MDLIKKVFKTPKLNIFAFSDWKKEGIPIIIEKIKKLDEIPNAIIYSGDGVEEFCPFPRDFLNKLFDDNINFKIKYESYRDKKEYNSNFLKCNFKKDNSFQEIKEVFVFKFNNIKKDLNRKEIIELIYSNLDFEIDYNNSNYNLYEISSRISWDLNKENLNKKSIIEYLDIALEFFEIKNKELIGLLYFRLDKNNYLELLSKEINCPIFYVIGNHETLYYENFKFNNCFNLDKETISLNKINFIGQQGIEDSDRKPIFYATYDNETIKNNLIKKIKKNKKYVLVSHSPPYSILDQESFGNENIGSKAIKEIVIKYSNQILLHLFGHVESYFGETKIYHKTLFANVATTSNKFPKGYLLQFKISDCVEEKKLHILPSIFEYYFLKNKSPSIKDLMSLFYFKETEANHIIETYKEIGKKFILDFEDIYYMKFEGSTPSLRQRIELYKINKSSKELTLNDMENIVKTVGATGVQKMIFYRAILNKKSIDSKKIIVFDKKRIINLKPIKKIYYDLEYDSGNAAYLYGFNVDGKVFQFDIYEEDKLKKFVHKHLDLGYFFINYAGADKKFTFKACNIKRSQENKFINFYYEISISIGLPIYDYKLGTITDYISNNIINKKLRKSPHLSKTIDTAFAFSSGEIPDENVLDKGWLSMKIMQEFNNKKDIRKISEFKYMKETNELDVINLKEIVEGIIRKVDEIK